MRLAAARLGAGWKSHICPSEYAYIKMVISFRNKLLNKMIASLRTMFVNKMLICAHVNFFVQTNCLRMRYTISNKDNLYPGDEQS